jgi:hypothetical protein
MKTESGAEMNKDQFIKTIQAGVKSNIEDAIEQFHGDELKGVEMTYEQWVDETTEDNGDATEYCYGL